MTALDRLAIAVAAAASEADDQITAGYWRFSRQARGALAPAEVYERRATARMVLATIREVRAERANCKETTR